MALVTNHTAVGSFQAATSGTVTVSNNANAIVVIDVFTERAHAAGSHASVTSITSSNTSGWQKHSDKVLDNSGHNTAYNHVERWWAYVASALTSEVYTVNVDNSVDAAAMIAYDFTGFTGTSYKTNPWDANSSLPVTGTGITSGSNPSISSLSTNGANCALLVAWASNDGSTITGGTFGGTGGTQIATKNNASGTVNWATITSAYLVVSSTESGIAVTGTSTIVTTWLGLADALNEAGGTTTAAGAGAADGFASVAGVGASIAISSGRADGTSSVAGVGASKAAAAGHPASILASAELDRHVTRTGEEYADALQSLLPLGQAWPRDDDSTLMKMVRGLTGIWGDIESRASTLLETESDPRRTIELLEDWERNFGLPDPCYQSPQNIGQRQLALVMRMTMLGAQSREFFCEIASMIGYTITITEYRTFICGIDRCGDNRVYGDGTNPMYDEWGRPVKNPLGVNVAGGELSEWPNYGVGPPENRFYWTVHVTEAALIWFRTGQSQCSDLLLDFGLADDLECLLNRWKPAHTQIIFDYSNLSNPDDPLSGLP